MSIRKTKLYKGMTSYLACAYAEGFCEGEGASETKQLTAWQYLVDTGMAWRLQGWYGRTASVLLEEGLVEPAIKDHVDFYGNVVKGVK